MIIDLLERYTVCVFSTSQKAFNQNQFAHPGDIAVLALLNPAMILILGGALSAPPKIKIIATISNAAVFTNHDLAQPNQCPSRQIRTQVLIKKSGVAQCLGRSLSAVQVPLSSPVPGNLFPTT
jgi:hypothetical protein